MFKAFWNVLNVKELRNRLLFTAGIIVLVRMADNIPCPGVNSVALKNYLLPMQTSSNATGGVMAMLDIFTGGALQQFALGVLGIMPYITASIIIQLLTPVVPSLEKTSRDGDAGRQKISQYTRYLTIVVCLVQGVLAVLAMIHPEKLFQHPPVEPLFWGNAGLFMVMTVLVLTCTTMIFMWLGEQITERGIGNGVSIIITINIVSKVPNAAVQLWQMATSQAATGSFKPVHLLILLLLFAAVTAATILICQGMRRVPVQMARKTIGNQVQGGTTYLPLKVNFAGVMPIIFAGAIMMIPRPVFEFFGWTTLATWFNHDAAGYMVLYGLLILAFSFFWVASQFNPLQISENLKRESGYIPGIRPGRPTADFLDSTMTKITFGGAVFLMALALFPMLLANSLNIPFLVASLFGGTSLLIMVGVTLDTMSQLESHLTMRNYEGFLKKGRLHGRSGF
ncbi:Protein translocase subunit SecY [bioreactor metagenome]|uniref:Protein translocase subunit SecY n=1 Tax=bioreactor metagenome TaxID=1076179 RepID=A0A644XZQ5_9ZZZZ